MSDNVSSCTESMRGMTIKPQIKPAVKIVEKREPGKCGRQIELNSNITPITLKKDVSYFKYDIRMNAVFNKRDGSEGFKEFSKQTKDDYEEQQRKRACAEIFVVLTNAEPIFQGNLIYDRAAILFSTKELDGVTHEERKFGVNPAVQSVCPDAIRIDVLIKRAADTFKVTSNDLASCVNADFKGCSKGLMEVLNLATSQIPFFSPKDFIVYGNGNIYILDPKRYGFAETEVPPINNDKFTAIGLSKGVKILEGNNQPGCTDYMPALVLDVKKSAFHFENQSLLDKLTAMYGSNFPSFTTMGRDLADLKCLTTHKKAAIVIGGFTGGPVSKATFKDRDGKTLSVCEYYEQKYKMRITRHDLPGVIDKHQRNIYPIDLLRVAPSQRVKGAQATKDTVEALIKLSAIKPEVRFKQTQRLSQVLQLSSPKCEETGVFVPENQPQLTVPGRQLNPIQLLGGQGGMAGPSWRGSNKFVVGAKLEKWAAFCFFQGGKARYTPESVFNTFCSKMTEAGTRKGMTIAAPAITRGFEVRGDPKPYVSEAMKMASDAGCNFVLVVSDERIKSHDQLKHEELVYNITTQEVTMAKAAQVAFESKQQTMENIIMKTNVKMRGMNHVTAADGGIHLGQDALVLGIFVQQPRSMSAAELEGGQQPSMPAVIGLSANNGNLQGAPGPQRAAATQQYFTTSWKYANPREWKTGTTQLATLKDMVIESLKTFKANRGGVIPKKVIVYRGGVSEGMLPYVARDEREAFVEAFHSLNPSYNPALVILACSKEHNERFYHKTFPQAPVGGRVDTNLPPGVIVDRVAVNPEMNEFYLQSHKALQGTARASKYTLLHESTGHVSNDAIQHMTYSLCHLHEVVNSTTAVPTPLYVAEESAKRAVNLYHHVRGINDRYDLDELNKTLSPTALGARVNA